MKWHIHRERLFICYFQIDLEFSSVDFYRWTKTGEHEKPLEQGWELTNSKITTQIWRLESNLGFQRYSGTPFLLPINHAMFARAVQIFFSDGEWMSKLAGEESFKLRHNYFRVRGIVLRQKAKRIWKILEIIIEANIPSVLQEQLIQ